MGVHVLVGTLDGTKPAACFVCSTSGQAIGGPILVGDSSDTIEDVGERAEAFLSWVAVHHGRDLRGMSVTEREHAFAEWKSRLTHGPAEEF